MSYKSGSLMMDTMHDDDPFGATLFGTSAASFDDPLYGTSPLLTASACGTGAAIAGIPSSPPIMPMKGLSLGALRAATGTGPTLLPPIGGGGVEGGAGATGTLDSHSGVFSSHNMSHMKLPPQAHGGNGGVPSYGSATATCHAANARRRSPSPSESGSTDSDSEEFLSDADTVREMGGGSGRGSGSNTPLPRVQHQMHMHAAAGILKNERGVPPPAPPMYVGATHDPKKHQSLMKPVPPQMKLKGVVKPIRNPEQHSPALSKTGAPRPANKGGIDALTGLPVPSFMTTGAGAGGETGGDSESDGTLADVDAFDTAMNMSPTALSAATAGVGGMYHPRPPPPPVATNGHQQQRQRQFGSGNSSSNSASFSQSIGTMGHMTSNGVMPMSDSSSACANPLMSTMARTAAAAAAGVPQLNFSAPHTMTDGGMSSGATTPSMDMRGALPPNGATANGIHVSASGRVETEVVRKRRLARKAELARSSRRKKKQRLTDLEGEVRNLNEELEQAHNQRKRDLEIIAELRAENAAMQAQAAARAQQQHQQQQQHMQSTKVQQQQQQQAQAQEAAAHAAAAAKARAAAEEGSAAAAQAASAASKPFDADVRAAFRAITGNQGASVTQMGALIDDFCGKLNAMNSKVGDHVAQLVDTPLVPLPVRFLEWAMSQNDDFFESKTQLWSQLFAQIGYSQQQMQNLLAFRDHMKTQRAMHKEVIAHTEALRAKQRDLYSTTNENFKEIREVFTQGQLAQFFAWCESNELCVNALMGASP